MKDTQEQNAIQTTHNLDFETAPYEKNIDPDNTWMRFRVGTCYGLYTFTEQTIDILAINNHESGNGHLEDVFEWFEYSCREHKKDLRILDVMNLNFLKHLIVKRGFKPYEDCNVIKKFI